MKTGNRIVNGDIGYLLFKDFNIPIGTIKGDDLEDSLKNVFGKNGFRYDHEQDIRSFYETFSPQEKNETKIISFDGGVYTHNIKNILNVSSTRAYTGIEGIESGDKTILQRSGSLDNKDYWIEIDKHKSIVFVDDGIWSGSTIDSFVSENMGSKKLKEKNANILTYYDFTGGKYSKIPHIKARVENPDEIKSRTNQRDLIIGISLSGASVIEKDRIIGYPYWISKRMAKKKMNISEEQAASFIETMIDYNLDLYGKIQEHCSKLITLEDCTRIGSKLIYGVLEGDKESAISMQSFLTLLRKYLRKNNYLFDF